MAHMFLRSAAAVRQTSAFRGVLRTTTTHAKPSFTSRLMTTTTRSASSNGRVTMFKWIAGAAGVTAVATTINVSKAEPTEETTVPGPSLFKKCVAEAIGTGIIVGGGCGVVAASKYAASGVGVAGIALGFGASVALAIFATGNVSGAHLNPAVTLSFAVNRPEACPPEIVLPYIVAQVIGATIASVATFFTFQNGIKAMEVAQKVARGSGMASAQIFEGAFALMPNAAMVRTPGTLAAEIGLTACLAFMIYAATDSHNTVPAAVAPVMIGTTVSALIMQGGPICGAGMNPARDLGPRVVSMVAGLGAHAFRTPAWWAYSIGPIIGGILGGAAYNAALGTAEEEEASQDDLFA